MTLLWLKDAVHNAHGRTLAFTEKTDPKGCLHTTESGAWPSYDGWTVNPHATIMAIAGRGVVIRQHIDFGHASFSLRNLPGGVATNTDYVFQFELVGTCVKGGPGYYWPGADDAVLKDLLNKLILPLSTSFKIPLKAPAFQAYPASAGSKKPAGPSNLVRMTGPTFDNFSGWLGHQHVPENVHGDPGAFPWARMMALIPKPSAPKPKPPATEDIVALQDYVIKLKTQYQADCMNSNRADGFYKIGTPLPFDHLMLWGGPAMERLRHEMLAQNTAQAEQNKAVLAAISALSEKVDKLLPPTPSGDAQRV